MLERQGRLDEARAALAAARQVCPALTQAEVAWTHGRKAGERLAPFWEAGN